MNKRFSSNAAWTTVVLGDVCEVKRGTTITKDKTNPGQIPVVAGGIAPAYTHDIANRPANTITISGSGANAGFVNFYEQAIWASDCSTVRPKGPELDARFVYLYLLSKQQFIYDELRQGAAQPHVYAKDLAQLSIPFPALDEQRKIVAILDEAFEGIDRARANTEANLASASEILDAFIENEIFGNQSGELRKLDDCCDLITCGVAARPEYVERGIPFLSAQNVKNSSVIWSNYKFVSEETHISLTKHNRPQRGDVLYTRVGSFGEAAIIDRDNPFSIFVSLTLIKPSKLLLNRYLKHYLNSKRTKFVAKSSISGSGVGNLNVGTVRKFLIPLPCLSKQTEIADRVDELQLATGNISEGTKQKLSKIADLRQSLLQKAFAGELT